MNVCSLGGEGFSLSFLCLVLFLLNFLGVLYDGAPCTSTELLYLDIFLGDM